MKEKRYLKNAWAKKDREGSHWLFIESGDLKWMFCRACGRPRSVSEDFCPIARAQPY